MAKNLKFPNIKKQNLYFKGIVDNKYIFTDNLNEKLSAKDIHQILLNKITEDLKEFKCNIFKNE